MTHGYGAFQLADYLDLVAAIQDFPSEQALEFLITRGVRTVLIQLDLVKGLIGHLRPGVGDMAGGSGCF